MSRTIVERLEHQYSQHWTFKVADSCVIYQNECSLRTCVHAQQTKEQVVRWEEGKKWQTKMERVKLSLMEKERQNETLSKQLSTFKELYNRYVWRNSLRYVAGVHAKAKLK